MAIDLTEQLIPLRLVPGLPFIPSRRQGKRLNVATVFRWAQLGVRGLRLETVRVGGTLCTSRPALLEFFRKLAAGPDSAPRPASDSRRQLAVERELEKAGI